MSKPLAGLSRFAHLVSGRRPAAALSSSTALGGTVPAARADDDDDMEKGPNDEGADKYPVQGEEETDTDYAKRCREFQKKQAKAEDDDDDDDDGDGKGGENDDDDEGDDDGDRKEMSAAGAVRSARLHERGRCAAIFGHAAAGANPALAAALAFETDLPRKQAIALLKAGGAAPGTTLGGRMAAVPRPAIGPDGPAAPQGHAAVAAGVIAAYEQAKGLKKGS